MFSHFWSGTKGEFIVVAIHDTLKNNNANPFRIINRFGCAYEITFSQLANLRMAGQRMAEQGIPKAMYKKICSNESHMLDYHTSISDKVSLKTLKNFLNGEKGQTWWVIGIASGCAEDILHTAESLVNKYPERFGTTGTCFLKCVMFDEKYTFANTNAYLGSTNTVKRESVPLNTTTKVVERMEQLENKVKKGYMFNFVKCDYTLFHFTYDFSRIKGNTLLVTAGPDCSQFSRMNTTGSTEGKFNEAIENVLNVFSHIAACSPLLWILENPGSNTSAKGATNRRLGAQTFMRSLKNYRTTFSHCQLCDDDCFSRDAMKKDTDCFSNAHKVPHGVCGEKILVARGRYERFYCGAGGPPHKRAKHKQLPRGSSARARWPRKFFEGFVSSLCYLLDGHTLKQLREKCDEDVRKNKRRKRDILRYKWTRSV